MIIAMSECRWSVRCPGHPKKAAQAPKAPVLNANAALRRVLACESTFFPIRADLTLSAIDGRNLFRYIKHETRLAQRLVWRQPISYTGTG